MLSAQNTARVKLVIDTNTLIWALCGTVRPQGCWRLPPVVKQLLAEFAEVLSRPKFAARITARGTSAVAIALKLADEATVITPRQLSLPTQLRDPNDLPVLACALTAHVDAIVTGDYDLLTLGSFEGIHITPRRPCAVSHPRVANSANHEHPETTWCRSLL